MVCLKHPPAFSCAAAEALARRQLYNGSIVVDLISSIESNAVTL